MKRKIKRSAHVASAVFLAVIVGGCCLFFYGFKKGLEPETSPTKYAERVNGLLKASSNYDFLPKTIPSDAQRIGFFHQPGFLQGGDILALRLKLPGEKIAALVQELEHSGRKEVTDFGRIPTPVCFPGYEMTKPSGKNLFEGIGELPRSFRVFLYQCDIADIERNWNHNFLAFTAVSESDQEVVYYVDWW